MAASLRSATEGRRRPLFPANGENGMSKADLPAAERIIANTINETARRDPDALAAALVEAGCRTAWPIWDGGHVTRFTNGPRQSRKFRRRRIGLARSA